MRVNQISVFTENKFGRLSQIFALLDKEKIGIVASTVADTADYGILRLITPNHEQAVRLLAQHSISANVDEVFAIAFDQDRESYSHIIELFTKAGANIDYMYSFGRAGESLIVLHTKATEAARDVIRQNGLRFLTNVALSSYLNK